MVIQLYSRLDLALPISTLRCGSKPLSLINEEQFYWLLNLKQIKIIVLITISFVLLYYHTIYYFISEISICIYRYNQHDVYHLHE